LEHEALKNNTAAITPILVVFN